MLIARTPYGRGEEAVGAGFVREAVARGCRSHDGHGAQEASPIFAEAVPLLMRIIGIEAREKAA